MKICQYCGKEFEPTDKRQKYCNKECSYLYHLEQSHLRTMERLSKNGEECEWCGKKFIPKRAGQKYCCRSCREKSRRAELGASVKKNQRREPIEITCKYCGEKVVTYDINRTFCSKDCSYKFFFEKAQREKLERKAGMTCAVCGKPLTSYRSYIYCSRECSVKASKNSSNQIYKQNSEINRQMAKQRTSVKKPKLSISEICKLALAEHLSYGEYVEKYGV